MERSNEVLTNESDIPIVRDSNPSVIVNGPGKKRHNRLRVAAIVATVFLFVAAAVAVAVLLGTASDSPGDIVADELHPAWRWECHSSQCEKIYVTDKDVAEALSLGACQLFCGEGGSLWPLPTGNISLGNFLVTIDKSRITSRGAPSASRSAFLLEKAVDRFVGQITARVPSAYVVAQSGKPLIITFDIKSPDDVALTLDTNEGYLLKVKQTSDGSVGATITADNFFGARHGLETLSQLVVFDDFRKEIQIARDVTIEDAPVYHYRGVLLDTARNYFSVKSIKRTIDAMASSKLNTFHWHITDSHSFPFVSPSRPSLYQLGAYTPYKIYSKEDILDVVQYALVRGVRVLPEFDAPAHVGEGWQGLNVTACFNAQPWSKYCVEPPCGQLDPTKDSLYDILQDIYKDMFNVFQPDIFHMGGDEVSIACWNTSEEIQDWMLSKGWGLEKEDFIKLWGLFQDKALERVETVAGKKLPIIMWTSHLTELPQLIKYLPNETYIIQIWTTGTDEQVSNLLSHGYRVIISNYDSLYLDCGFGAWVSEGNNWCSPYKGWQKVYQNSPKDIAGSYKDQILGGEAALWTEQADEHTLDARLWPRAAALGERLWGEPKTGWRDAQYRMLAHRERLVEQGIAAEALQPQWCMQNEGDCPV